MNPILVFVMAVVATVVVASGQGMYWAYAAKQERETMERLRRLNMLGEVSSDGLLRDQARDAAAAALGSLGAHLESTILAADIPMPVTTLLGQMAGVFFVGMILGLWFVGLPGVLLGVVLAIAPYVRLRMAANSRISRLIQQLPEALDLMARSLQAGLGLNEAFRTCAEEMPMPIAGEFGRVFEEVRFGRDYREALNNMLARNPGLFDLRLFVSSVLLQRETGGNLIEILESISGTVRGRFLFQAKVKAMTSEARFSALILAALPLCVAAMIAVMSPKYLAPLLTDSLGNLMLGLAIALYVFGGFLMYKMSQVEV